MIRTSAIKARRAWGYYKDHGKRALLQLVWRKLALQSPFRKLFSTNTAAMPILTSQLPPARLSRQLFHKPRIVILGDLNLPQCRKYRVIQKLEILQEQGIWVNYSHWEDVPRSRHILQLATTAIFYRTRAGTIFDEHLRECRRLGVETAYDLDDPIFSRRIYERNINLNFLDTAEKTALIATTDQYLLAMRATDYVIGSTPRICQEMAQLVRAPVYLWRNALDHEAWHAASLVMSGRVPEQKKPDAVTIAYASGSRAHEADFRVAERALRKVMLARPEVRLKVIGYLNLPDSFKDLARRIDVLPFSGYQDYLAELAQCDFSIVPLVDDAFNDCKSAIRYLDAASVGVPTLASAVGDMKHVVKNGETGITVSNSGWTEALHRMTTDAGLRQRLSAAALTDVRANHSTTGLFDRLSPVFRRRLLNETEPHLV